MRECVGVRASSPGKEGVARDLSAGILVHAKVSYIGTTIRPIQILQIGSQPHVPTCSV